MDRCCEDAACEIEKLRTRQGATLRIVLAINAAMFGAELAAGILAGSVSLVADSLDMLGDALAYGLSLWAVGRDAGWKAQSAMVKGLLMGALGLGALAQAVCKLSAPRPPALEAMGLMGLAALAANAACLLLLARHRAEDINMHSVWVCSRNDIMANLSVLLAGLGVWLFRSGWPDALVGAALAAFILRSAAGVVGRARLELRA